MYSGNVTGIGHINIAKICFAMTVMFKTLSRVLLLLTDVPSDFIYLARSVFRINSKGPTNSDTLHWVSTARKWTRVLRGNAFDSDNLSPTEFICCVRSKKFSFGTLSISSLEKFFMKSCKEVMTTFPVLNISSNAIFSNVIPNCSSSSKVSYFPPILFIRAQS